MTVDIVEAFKKDGYRISKEMTRPSGARGYIAKSKTVINTVTGKPKKAYYAEGSAHDMGFLIGSLAPGAVKRLVKNFPNNIIMSYLDPAIGPFFGKIIAALLYKFISDESQKIKPSLPKELLDEMQGVADGVQSVRPDSVVDFENILTINVGFDFLTALAVNPLSFFQEIEEHLKILDIPEEYKTGEKSLFRLPHICHAYSAFGDATTDRPDGGKNHFFGREFQFPPGDVFQDTAAFMVYVPNDKRISLVAVAAPGFVGSVTAMNKFGITMGVDTVPASDSDAANVGLNSLMLVRHSIHNAKSGIEAVEIVREAPRGAPWIYPFSDGTNDTAGTIEAGKATDKMDPWTYVDKDLIEKDLIPTPKYMKEHAPELPDRGMMVRWSDYKYPTEFIDRFNPGLFDNFGEKFISENFTDPTGFVFPSYDGTGGFGFYYFSPQREQYDDVVIATNLWLHPRMALCSMNSLVALLLKQFWTDIQWRYDSLNKGIVDNYGKIDFEKGWTILNIINPDVTGNYDYQKFYGNEKAKTQAGKNTYMIDGVVCFMDCKAMKIRALYGYYSDQPIELNLLNYLAD